MRCFDSLTNSVVDLGRSNRKPSPYEFLRRAFFHNNNDLERRLTQLPSNPEYVYLLQFSLNDVQRDGTYHRLTVKVDQPHLAVQARRGYFAPFASDF